MDVSGQSLLIHLLLVVVVVAVSVGGVERGANSVHHSHRAAFETHTSLTARRAEEVHHDGRGAGKHIDAHLRSRGHRATPRGEGWQLLAIDDTLVAERSPEVTRQCVIQSFYFVLRFCVVNKTVYDLGLSSVLFLHFTCWTFDRRKRTYTGKVT